MKMLGMRLLRSGILIFSGEWQFNGMFASASGISI